MTDRLLARAAAHASAFIDGVGDRPVAALATSDELRARLARPLADVGVPAEQVLDDLVRDVEGGLLGSTGPRFFGWVIGGALPADASVAFVTGTQSAHLTALAAARGHLLAARGHDVDRHGLHGAPPLRVLAGAAHHASLDRAVRLLGLGTDALETVPADDCGRPSSASRRAT